MSVVIERFIADNYLVAVDLAREAEKADSQRRQARGVVAAEVPNPDHSDRSARRGGVFQEVFRAGRVAPSRSDAA
jgi:hypothetical protein